MRWSYRWSYSIVVFLFLFCVSCTTTQSNCQGCQTVKKTLHPQVIFINEKGQKISVHVELACTPNERAQGLMYRKKMAAFSGMLFIFPIPQVQGFWMKNTFIPLDMIHLNEKKEIVGVIENAKPHSLTSRKIDAKSMYVIEVNAFFARKHGIKIGQSVQFLEVPSCGTP